MHFKWRRDKQELTKIQKSTRTAKIQDKDKHNRKTERPAPTAQERPAAQQQQSHNII